MKRMPRVCILLVGAALAALAPGFAGGQPAPMSQPASASAPARPEMTAADMASRIAQTEAATDIEDAVKKPLIVLYKQAQSQLQSAEQWSSRAAEHEQKTQNAPAQLALLKAAATQPASDPKVEAPADAGLSQLEQMLSKVARDLDDAQTHLASLNAEPTKRADRRIWIQSELPRLKQKSDALTKDTAAAVPGEAPELASARRMLAFALRRAVERRMAAYGKELQYFDASVELLAAQRDDAVRQVARTEKLLKAWRDLVSERRRGEAERAERGAAEARRAAAAIHPAVKPDAEVNAKLAALRTGPDGLTAKIERAQGDLDEIKKLEVRIQADFQSLKGRVDLGGLTNAVGLLLRKQRAALPDVGFHRRRIQARETAVSDTLFAAIERDDQRKALAVIEPRVAAVLALLGPTATPAERADVESVERKLLTDQIKLLDDLATDTNTLLKNLGELDKEERQLVDQVRACTEYIDEHIFWVRGAAPLHSGDLPKMWAGLQWLADPDHWTDVGRRLWRTARPDSGIAAGLLALVVLVALRRRLRRKLSHLGAQCERGSAVTFVPTLQALALTLLISIDVPWMLWFVGWHLERRSDAPEFARAVAVGLQTTAFGFFAFRFFRQLCRPKGLAAAHFGWPAGSVRLLRRHLLWLMLLGAPAVFIVSVMAAQSTDAWNDSLGRAAVLFGLLLLALFCHFVLRPHGGVMRDAAAHNPTGWVVRLRYFWYLLGIGTPLTLAVLAATGYVYTAIELTWRINVSVWFTVGLVLFHAMLHRWSVVTHRWLAIRQARELRAARAAGAESVAAEAEPTADETRVDLWTMSTQTRHFLRTVVWCALAVGLWAIWVDVLPALAMLNRVELWSQTARVAQEITRPDGPRLVEMVEQTVPVTLADLALAVLTVVLTVIAARNLPGLLEIAVLQRLPVSAGGRYAITTVSRYVITTLGLVIAFGEIGIGWAKVQWLAAALTFGLGFGLQEIFANFISGLIILFERPVRVGDIVSVGNLTGTISRIRIRATTLTDGDRKELIIPNKEFITGQLVNWTLSDTILRVVVPVGVSYASDVEQTRRILVKVAQDHPDVLKDPAPAAFFTEFGDNTLNFRLHAFVHSPETLYSTRHDLLSGIAFAFREAGIEISFPQRDLHLRSADQPIPVQIRREPASRRARRGDVPASPIGEI